MDPASPASGRELQSLIEQEQEQEPLLDLFSPPPINTKVEACKEMLYSGVVGGLTGLTTGLCFSLLFYANSSKPAFIPVGTVANTVGGLFGAIMGTVAKNGLSLCGEHRSIRALIGGLGTCSYALTFYNATAWGLGANMPLWSQFVVGTGGALVGAIPSGCVKGRKARLLTGFLTSVGAGAAAGMGLGIAISQKFPELGTKGPPILGALATAASLFGYTGAIDKYN